MFYIKTISRPSESEAYTEPALVLLKAKYKVYSVKMWYQLLYEILPINIIFDSQPRASQVIKPLSESMCGPRSCGLSCDDTIDNALCHES